MTSQPTLTKPENDPRRPGDPGTSGDSGLQAGLKNRHLSMIAIGGVIGAGLFVGSSSGIATAGPGILLSYALVGTLVVLVMRMLGEMSAANPTSGSFSAHADRAALYDRLGFDTVSAGPLSESWRLERDRPAYVARQTAAELRENLAKANRLP